MQDEANAYDILLKRHLNDDRLLAERSSLFLASSSILFLGFVVLDSSACLLRIFLPVVGLILSGLAVIGNRRTSIGLGFWEKGEEIIENEKGKFEYMKQKGIVPHAVYKDINKGWLGWIRIRNRHIYTYLLPSLFIVLWVISLISARVN